MGTSSGGMQTTHPVSFIGGFLENSNKSRLETKPRSSQESLKVPDHGTAGRKSIESVIFVNWDLVTDRIDEI
jgi:hypothetical protein